MKKPAQTQASPLADETRQSEGGAEMTDYTTFVRQMATLKATNLTEAQLRTNIAIWGLAGHPAAVRWVEICRNELESRQ